MSDAVRRYSYQEVKTIAGDLHQIQAQDNEEGFSVEEAQEASSYLQEAGILNKEVKVTGGDLASFLTRLKKDMQDRYVKDIMRCKETDLCEDHPWWRPGEKKIFVTCEKMFEFKVDPAETNVISFEVFKGAIVKSWTWTAGYERY